MANARWLSTIYVCLATLATTVPTGAFARPNGPYGAPAAEGYHQLQAAEHEAFRGRYDALREEGSVFLSEAGAIEMRRLLAPIWRDRHRYSQILSLGRSGTGFLSYLRGRQSAAAEKTPTLADLPFSYGNRYQNPSAEQTVALREHLAANGFSPKAIAALDKPILLFDFVYGGKSQTALLRILHEWAREEAVSEAMREKLHFVGFYNAEDRAREVIFDIYHSTLKEMSFHLAPDRPTDAQVFALAEQMSMLNEPEMERRCGQVHAVRISSKLYHYAGTKDRNSHESFTRDRWGEPLDRHQGIPTFRGKQDDPAFVDLHFLLSLGMADQWDCREHLAEAS